MWDRPAARIQVSVQCDREEYPAKDNIRHGRGSQCSKGGGQGDEGGGGEAGPGESDMRDVPVPFCICIYLLLKEAVVYLFIHPYFRNKFSKDD